LRIPANAASGLALAAASALLHLAASPPFEICPLALLAAAPAFLLLRNVRPAPACAWGWLLGLLTGVVGLYWLPKPLAIHAGVSATVAWLLTLLYCAYQACRWAALGWLVASARDAGLPRGLAFCLAYPVSELLLPLLLPWHLGELVAPTSWLAQCADLGGPLLVSLLVASSGVAFARLIDGWRAAGREWLVHALLWTCALAYGALRSEQVGREVAAAPSVRVGMVQANLVAGGSDARSALERALELTKPLVSAAVPPLDLVVWSETIASVPLSGRGEDFALARLLSSRVPVPLLFGASATFDIAHARQSSAYNSAFLTTPLAPPCIGCRYDKQLLFPVGEYVPGATLWQPLGELFPRGGLYSVGPLKQTIPLAGERLAVTICYEDLHAAYVRDLVAEGQASLMLNLTDDAWFRGTPGSAWHFKLSVLRAVEQRRFLVRVANSGVSASVDALGNVVQRLPEDLATTTVATPKLLHGATMFQRLGHYPFWLLTVLLLSKIIIHRWRVARRPAEARELLQGRPRLTIPHS
jgi:apolipoprotein N-acyltransferase